MKTLFTKILSCLVFILFIITLEKRAQALEFIDYNKYNQGLNSYEWKQYVEILTGINYGSAVVKYNGDKFPNDFTSKSQSTYNFALGYGLKYNVFSFGLRGQINLIDNPLVKYNVTTNRFKTFRENYSNLMPLKMESLGIYSLFIVEGIDLINYKRYKATVIGGVGISLHNIKYNRYSYINGPLTHKIKKENELISTFVFMAGVQQEYLITKNLALGLEINYVNFGSPKFNDKLYFYDGVVDKASYKINLNEMLNANLSIKLYL